MKLPRISLRSFLLLSILLPALFGMLWRFGQLDCEAYEIPAPDGIHKVCSVRVYRFGLEYLDQTIRFRQTQAWSGPGYDWRKTDPWDRKYAAIMCDRFIISWHKPVSGGSTVGEAYPQCSRVVVNIRFW